MKRGEIRIEYDPRKRQTNLTKHGIDFEAARALLSDPELVCIELAFPDEPRSLCIGCLEGRPTLAVLTYRGECVRIISMFRFSMKMMRTLLNRQQAGDLDISEDALTRLMQLVQDGCE